VYALLRFKNLPFCREGNGMLERKKKKWQDKVEVKHSILMRKLVKETKHAVRK